MIKKAKVEDQIIYNDKSFMKGEGNFVGRLGECITYWYRPDFIEMGQFDYDCIWKHRGKSETIDIKTKYQSPSCEPSKGWMASVCKDSEHQEVDNYIFCRIYKNGDNYPYGWVIGGISKKDFFDKATFYRKGQKEGDNGYEVKQGCWSLPYSELFPIKAIRK